ncbi:MAG: prolyl oligopeptidase family serine peptidase [Bacteroidota bacterium]
MNKRFLMLGMACLYLAFSLPSLFAQNITVSVKDSLDQHPLAYATLYLKVAGMGKRADENGIAKFPSQTVETNDTLVVTYIGYHPQRIPLTPNPPSQIQVSLRSSVFMLDEVKLVYQKPLKPEQIVRRAIKNVPKNYAPDPVILKGLYRETIQENDRYIQLDEAMTELYYTGYPQRKLSPRLWETWYYTDVYAFDLEADDIFDQILHDLNTPQEQMRVLHTRSSENHSQYGLQTVIMGGPMDLTAWDKVKYAYDFLDPRLVSKYAYTLAGRKEENGVICYVLDFYPKSLEGRIVFNQSKKNKRPIYYGKLYIDMESFAVVKYNYSLAVSRDFGYYNPRIPLSFTVSVDYRRMNGKWYLDHIHGEQLEDFGKAGARKPILHVGIRDFFIQDIQQQQVAPFPDSTLWLSSLYTALRSLNMLYQREAWDENPVVDLHPWPAKLQAQLEVNEPLEEQFASKLSQTEARPLPLVPKQTITFDYPLMTLRDDYHWLTMPRHEEELADYLRAENAYAKDQIRDSRDYQRKMFRQLGNFYLPDSSRTQVAKPKKGTFYFEEDSLGQSLYYEQVDSVQSQLAMNLTRFNNQHPQQRIKRIIPNPQRTYLLVLHQQLSSMADSATIVTKGKQQQISALGEIYEIRWWGNETVVYAKSNGKGGAKELWSFHLPTQHTHRLYRESDSTFDLRIIRRTGQLHMLSESKSESETWLLRGTPASPKLDCVQKRQTDVHYQIHGSSYDWYMLSNQDAPNNQIYHTKDSLPRNWQLILEEKSQVYLQDLWVTPEFLITKSYEKSFPKVKYRHKNSSSWQAIELPHTLCEVSVELDPLQPHMLYLWASGPSTPIRKISWNMKRETSQVTYPQQLKPYHWSRFLSSKRMWAKSTDNARVPMTLLWSRNPVRKHQGCILKVYGAYGAITQPYFSEEDALLARQGYTVVYAHVRGESIMGGDWYTQGKLLQKKHSFEDYIACAQHLVKKGVTTPEFLVAYGNSAGGIVVGWAINTHPEWFNTAILDHPYLDVLHTTMNDSLPLTVDEYKEWGDPSDPAVFSYIQSYCPYQNIRKQAYPHLIYRAGWHDFQTPVAQIAKHVAAVRTNHTGDQRILFFTDFQGAHGGNFSAVERKKSFAGILGALKQHLFDK